MKPLLRFLLRLLQPLLWCAQKPRRARMMQKWQQLSYVAMPMMQRCRLWQHGRVCMPLLLLSVRQLRHVQQLHLPQHVLK